MAKYFLIVSPLKYFYSITAYNVGAEVIPGVNYSLSEEVFSSIVLHNFSIQLLVVASGRHIVVHGD